MTRKTICICGMHRSGTSLVAQTISRCGIYLGPEDVLRTSAPDNQDGFWEDIEFVRLNDALLGHFLASWNMPLLPAGWQEQGELAPLRARARALVEQRGAKGIWGWKDPRTSLTLPFWKDLIPDLRVLMCVRHPLEVAQSLARRNGFSVPFGLELWQAYHARVLAATAPDERVVSHYDSHFADPPGELRRILRLLQVQVPEERLQDASAACKASLRHNRTDADLRQTPFPPRVAELYRELCAEAGPGRRLAMVSGG